MVAFLRTTLIDCDFPSVTVCFFQATPLCGLGTNTGSRTVSAAIALGRLRLPILSQFLSFRRQLSD
ncbi:MAG: hypothetical protein ACKOJF_29035, partial [Planctomycetaceae bacterium]